MPPDHARLTIDFDLRADPIAGVVHDDARDGGAPFAGWMQLTRAIERALDAARRPADADPLTNAQAEPGPAGSRGLG